MALNPMEMMKLGERLRIFREQHPKVEGFISNQLLGGLQEGTVIEMKVTRTDGTSSICNFRVTADDLETLSILRHLRS